MIDLLLIHLNIITHKKKITANIKCTVSLVFRFCFSLRSSLFFKPRISMQKEEVRAVNAPSALGNNAEIKAMIKMIEMNDGKYCKAIVGKRSSPLIAMFCVVANRYSKPPSRRNKKFTSTN